MKGGERENCPGNSDCSGLLTDCRMVVDQTESKQRGVMLIKSRRGIGSLMVPNGVGRVIILTFLF